MRVKNGQFCSISKKKEWQEWLANIDEDLYDMLMTVVNERRGCRTNKEIMMKIYRLLYERGHGADFEQFIDNHFPWMIESRRNHISSKICKVRSSTNCKEINKHKVFKSYRPDLLTFPHKLILVDDVNVIEERVKAFVADKILIDYIIIDDHAYIEYLQPKYADLIDEIPMEAREIHTYQMRTLQ